MEDLSDLIKDYQDKTGGFQRKDDKSVLKRVLFLYGTSYSQRENCIIGKVAVEISYTALRQFLSRQEQREFKREQRENKGRKGQNPHSTCFLHRETFINRKIPLNALISVYIDRVTNLKESIENIEHFAKIHQTSLDRQDDLFEGQPVMTRGKPEQ